MSREGVAFRWRRWLYNYYHEWWWRLIWLMCIIIGFNRPAFGGTVPHFHQMSRVPWNERDVPHFKKWYYFFLSIADYFTFLPGNATKWRIKLGSYFARRQTASIFHAWQPSPVTAYFVTPPAASTLLPWRAMGDGFSLDNRQRSSDSARCFPYSRNMRWRRHRAPVEKMAPKRKCKFNEDYRSLASKVACQWHGSV